MSFTKKHLLFLCFIVSLVFSMPKALCLFEINQNLSQGRLLVGQTDHPTSDVLWAGLEIKMKPGWKTYWRSPGAAGYPLKINWLVLENVSDVSLSWPTPSKFETFGFTANGYKEHVIFPLKLRLKDPKKQFNLKAKIDYLVCDPNNCIPQTKEVTLQFLPGDMSIAQDVHALTEARARLPQKESPELFIESAEFSQPDQGPAFLKVKIIHKQPLVNPSLFFENSKKIYFDGARFLSELKSEHGLVTTAEIPLYVTEKKEALRVDNLIGSSIKITLSTHQLGMEQSLLITAPSLPMVERLLMYLFALIGGFILNFMPCVLPVILLKIFSLLKESEKTQHLRISLSFSVAGMLVSFALLGGISILFKKIGYSLGWGLQFQEPFFLYFMMLVLVFFTANFWGFYEFNLPSRFANIGYEQTTKSGNLGHFMSGMFATFLATPCSAPYLGTAVSFALSRGATEIMLIFLCLGLGLALPFMLVIAFPRVSAYFPKPGPWMDTFRHVLGWGFILTLLWLLYVMNQQLSYKSVLAITLVLIAILMLLWVYSKKEVLRRFYLVPLCIVLAVGGGGGALLQKHDAVSTQEKTNVHQKLEEIKKSVAQGKTVFVCVTADWCLTCKANEYLVLETKEFKALLNDYKATYVVIDWTSRDAHVYEYLKLFGKEGIPFYAVYGPKNPYGKALSQILTLSSVRQAFEKAKG